MDTAQGLQGVGVALGCPGDVCVLCYPPQDCRLAVEEAKRLCSSTVARSPDFTCIQIVYGSAGERLSRDLSHDPGPPCCHVT